MRGLFPCHSLNLPAFSSCHKIYIISQPGSFWWRELSGWKAVMGQSSFYGGIWRVLMFCCCIVFVDVIDTAVQIFAGSILNKEMLPFLLNKIPPFSPCFSNSSNICILLCPLSFPPHLNYIYVYFFQYFLTNNVLCCAPGSVTDFVWPWASHLTSPLSSHL